MTKVPGIWRCFPLILGIVVMCTGALAEVPRPQARPDIVEARTIVPPETPPSVDLPAVIPSSTPVPEAPETESAIAEIPASLTPPDVGPETNLPLPRYVSLKSDEANVRRGPSLSHRIDWVFLRRGMPLQVTAEYGHWRRVIDRDGIGGWVHYALISGNRTVIVDENMLSLHRRPDADAPVAAQLEAGVIARLDECEIDWCRISAGGYRGWVLKTALWGVEADEIRD